MIGYVKGVVSHIFSNSCFIDVHGVGYRTYAPASTLDTLIVGQEALLYTYMSVREDAILLYGFATQDEYDLFMLLIGVNGVGPKVALGILSADKADGFRLAVHQKDIKSLTKMPGIGKKTPNGLSWNCRIRLVSKERLLRLKRGLHRHRQAFRAWWLKQFRPSPASVTASRKSCP